MIRDNNIVLGSILLLIAVGLGAFGAHALEETLVSNGRVDTWETAVSYHFYHGFAILVSALFLHHFSNRNIQRAIYCFLIGILLFSGSLYVLSLTGIAWLGAVTPFGGGLFILGWLLLAIGASKK